jgi:hypothetical protein
VKTLLTGVLVTVLLLVAAGPAPPATTADRSGACAPGVRQLGGKTVQVFCGPAQARVRVGHSTEVFRHGACARQRGGFTVNIGTSGSPKLPYFGLVVDRARAGVYEDQSIAFTHVGRVRIVIDSTVVLAKGLKGGTFKGELLGNGLPVSGSFTC